MLVWDYIISKQLCQDKYLSLFIMNSQFVNYVLINNIPEKQYKRMANSAGSECSGPSSNPILPLTNCMILAKVLSKPQFPHF